MIGLTKSAVWLPDTVETSAEIAQKSGIPVSVIEEKMGIIQKCRTKPHMQPSQMAVNAAREVLEGEDPASIDMIIWTGSEYKDYNVWSAGIFVQEQLGLHNAFAFDMAARCSTNVVGLKVAKSLMMSDPKINKVLLCGGHKTGDLVNYKDPKSRFLYNLSDGGSAMLLEKGKGNEILDASIITDGSFSHDVIIPAGGTKAPARGAFSKEDTYLQVPDVEGMRERLAEKSIQNFIKVIMEAGTTSMSKPIDYLGLLHMKKSAHDEILKRLELKQEQSCYLNRYGHFGAPDQVLSLGLAERRQLLQPGSHVVLASAGIGYTWSAISIKWEQDCFMQKTINHYEGEQ
jgi:3-oxoacyl-[acyl-carrier-protein] synthase-3